MADTDRKSMGDDRRGMMTDREVEILSAEADVSEKYYGVVVTRVRNRIGRLEKLELPAMEEHDTLADELREVVCDETNAD